MNSRILGTTFSLGILSVLVACGSTESSEFGNGSNDEGALGTGGGSGQTFNGSNGSNASGGVGSTVLNECATTKLGAQLSPANLVVMYDQSGSMGDGTGGANGRGEWSCNNQNVFCEGGVLDSNDVVCYRNTNGQLTFNGGNLSKGGQACAAGKLPGGNPGFFCDGVVAGLSGCTMSRGFDPAKKWVPVANAMSAFFESPQSKGVQASLSFFPKQLAQDASEFCAPASFSSASTSMQPLPSAAFKADLSKHYPTGATPTGPAITGAYEQAKSVTLPGTTAIVLVTDGQPYGCNGTNGSAKDFEDARTAIASASGNATKPIKTYVIGIQDGQNLSALNELAVAGKSGSATIVSVSDPSSTTASVLKALETIRGQAISCDVPLPAPPAGQTLEIGKVNVVVSVGGKDSVLSYSKDCANGSGWHYDNPSSPKMVQLCPASCSSARGDSNGKLSIAFGCSTQGGSGQIF